MHVAITDGAISADGLLERLLKPSDGAVVTFEGVVRDHTGQRRTRYLEYQAYAGMAQGQMEMLGREALARWALGDVAMVHRTGRLEVGETSVVIAVASSHRAEAFEACRHLIDRLKQVVPIWKKEVTEDGYTWVEGPVRADAATVANP